MPNPLAPAFDFRFSSSVTAALATVVKVHPIVTASGVLCFLRDPPTPPRHLRPSSLVSASFLLPRAFFPLSRPCDRGCTFTLRSFFLDSCLLHFFQIDSFPLLGGLVSAAGTWCRPRHIGTLLVVPGRFRKKRFLTTVLGLPLRSRWTSLTGDLVLVTPRDLEDTLATVFPYLSSIALVDGSLYKFLLRSPISRFRGVAPFPRPVEYQRHGLQKILEQGLSG